jgi:hypothetical protein
MTALGWDCNACVCPRKSFCFTASTPNNCIYTDLLAFDVESLVATRLSQTTYFIEERQKTPCAIRLLIVDECKWFDLVEGTA